MRRLRLSSVVGLGGIVCSLVGCGPRTPANDWLPADAAAVTCVDVDVSRGVPPLAHELPMFEAPKNFLIRDMAPEDLFDLGFEPSSIACAAALPPSWEEVGALEEEVRSSTETLEATLETLRREEPCLCALLQGMAMAWADSTCIGAPALFGCRVDDLLRRRELEPKLAPVREVRARVYFPMEHWRLVGQTDRPGVWSHRFRRFRRRYEGSVEPFDAQHPPQSGVGRALIMALLEAPDVVMVVRQDGGRGYLVVREMGRDTLIFDLFRKPVFGAESSQMLASMDDAHVEQIRAALARPSDTMRVPRTAVGARTMWLYRDGLERLDAVSRLVAKLFGASLPAEVEEAEDALVERVRWRVPLGETGPGVVSEATLTLSEAGRAWIATQRAAGYIANIYEMAEAVTKTPSAAASMLMASEASRTPPPPPAGTVAPPPDERAPEPPANDVADADLDSPWRRTPALSHLWFHGLARGAVLLSAAEFTSPGSLKGTVDAWTLPVSLNLRGGDLTVVPGLRRMVSRLASNPHTLSGTVADDGKIVTLRLERTR